MKLPSIGVIGHGFVGKAIADGFKHYTSVKVYDVNPMSSVDNYFDVVGQDILFMCLPTPMLSDGSADLKPVRSALEVLRNALQLSHKPVILKSTVPPTSLVTLADEFRPDIHLIYNPEFLTERTAALDFQQQNRLIFGHYVADETATTDLVDAYQANMMAIEDLFSNRFPAVPVYWVPIEQASLIKYFTNVFFATKISLFNEFAQICKSFGLDANETAGLVLMDQRIGRSHWQVPGHDEKLGFGGSCFPKDINGYITFAREQGVAPMLALAAWHKNLEVRPEKDWEKLKGRAVSEEKV
jgi:nucleotide sugar dehydrogenase